MSRGAMLLAVLVVIGLAIYFGNVWIERKKEAARQYARDYTQQAEEHRINEVRQMVEKAGGTYYQGIAINPKALIGPVPLDGGRSSSDTFLVVEVFIENFMPDRRTVSYRTWPASDFAPDGPASLTDNQGRRYARVELADLASSSNYATSATLAIRGHVRDRLLFEAPAGEVEYLDLRLPAANVGAQGVIELRIPTERIRHGQ